MRTSAGKRETGAEKAFTNTFFHVPGIRLTSLHQNRGFSCREKFPFLRTKHFFPALAEIPASACRRIFLRKTGGRGRRKPVFRLFRPSSASESGSRDVGNFAETLTRERNASTANAFPACRSKGESLFPMTKCQRQPRGESRISAQVRPAPGISHSRSPCFDILTFCQRGGRKRGSADRGCRPASRAHTRPDGGRERLRPSYGGKGAWKPEDNPQPPGRGVCPASGRGRKNTGARRPPLPSPFPAAERKFSVPPARKSQVFAYICRHHCYTLR